MNLKLSACGREKGVAAQTCNRYCIQQEDFLLLKDLEMLLGTLTEVGDLAWQVWPKLGRNTHINTYVLTHVVDIKKSYYPPTSKLQSESEQSERSHCYKSEAGLVLVSSL